MSDSERLDACHGLPVCLYEQNISIMLYELSVCDIWPVAAVLIAEWDFFID